MTPAQAAPGDPVVFEVLVPGETDAHTTEVSLQIPEDVLPFSFEDVPGWRRTVENADDGSIAVVRWRGRLATDGFVRFGFLASTPEQEGELVWKAVQRYDDGEEAAWIGPPDSDNPAPVTRVSADAARVNAGGEGSEAEEPEAADAGAEPAADERRRPRTSRRRPRRPRRRTTAATRSRSSWGSRAACSAAPPSRSRCAAV